MHGLKALSSHYFDQHLRRTYAEPSQTEVADITEGIKVAFTTIPDSVKDSRASAYAALLASPHRLLTQPEIRAAVEPIEGLAYDLSSEAQHQHEQRPELCGLRHATLERMRQLTLHGHCVLVRRRKLPELWRDRMVYP